MSSLRRNSNSEMHVVDDQKIEPNEHYEEVGHVTDSINHGCGQVCNNICNENVVLYLENYRFHLENHFENETEKQSQKCGVISYHMD